LIFFFILAGKAHAVEYSGTEKGVSAPDTTLGS